MSNEKPAAPPVSGDEAVIDACPLGVPKTKHGQYCKCDHYLCWSDLRIQAELARLGPDSDFAHRLKAHEALMDKISCNDPRPRIKHDWVCDDVTDAIKDAYAAGLERGRALGARDERGACAAAVRAESLEDPNPGDDGDCAYGDAILDALAAIARRSGGQGN